MAINIFKINTQLLSEFENKIYSKKSQLETIKVNPETFTTSEPIEATLSIDNGGDSQKVEWSWIGAEFAEIDIDNRTSNPRGWLIIKLSTESVYCLSFGIAYHDPSKYCDSDFPFRILQSLDIKDIKNTTRMNPTSNRRRMIDAFVAMDEIDFDAGDTIQKVTFLIDSENQRKRYSKELPFKENIIVGNSIKVIPLNHTLGCVLDCLLCLEEICELEKVLDVPVLKRISDKNRIQELDEKIKNIPLDQMDLSIPAFQVIGVKNWDYDDITQFQYHFQNEASRKFNALSINDLINFIKLHNLDSQQAFESVTVTVTNSNGDQPEQPLSMFLEYVNETDKTMLLNGAWFSFNDDYIKFINSEIADTQTTHQVEYDYLEKKLIEDRKSASEADFNKWIAENSTNPQYLLLDRVLYNPDGEGKFELCDLYDDAGGTLVAVKKVSDSQSFCYVMDQSITAAKALKSIGTIKLKDKRINWKDIRKYVIWIILNRKSNNQIDKDNERPKIEDLKYFLAKMKIPTWKRELKNLGIIPVIYVSYEDN